MCPSPLMANRWAGAATRPISSAGARRKKAVSEPIETPTESDGNASLVVHRLAVELDLRELAVLCNVLAPAMVHARGEQSWKVELFEKLNAAFTQLVVIEEGEDTMPAGAKSYQAAHIPDRASGSPTGRGRGHAEPATKTPMKEKTVQQVMGETPHAPAPRDTEKAVKKGNGGTNMKANKGS
jgi:hypothetical protein